MTAYVIANLDVTDLDAFAEYAAASPATVKAHGGEYVARGGESETLEGDTPANRIVLLRFPTAAAARSWYHSAEYSKLRELRLRAATGSFILTAGVDEAY